MVDLVGPLKDVHFESKDEANAESTIRESCIWRVRNYTDLDTYNGNVFWTTSSVFQESRGLPFAQVTIAGHPALLGQSRGNTLLLVSTSGDTHAAGELIIHLATGRPGSKDVALSLAKAALKYVASHHDQ